jgi:hypothetical protein
VEEREIVVEPFCTGWLAYYRGDRSYRVTAETPEEARKLLVAGEQSTPYVHVQQRTPLSGMAVLVCVLVATALVVLKVTAQNAPMQHLAKWAHHQHHSHARR